MQLDRQLQARYYSESRRLAIELAAGAAMMIIAPRTSSCAGLKFLARFVVAQQTTTRLVIVIVVLSFTVLHSPTNVFSSLSAADAALSPSLLIAASLAPRSACGRTWQRAPIALIAQSQRPFAAAVCATNTPIRIHRPIVIERANYTAQRRAVTCAALGKRRSIAIILPVRLLRACWPAGRPHVGSLIEPADGQTDKRVAGSSSRGLIWPFIRRGLCACTLAY